MPSILERLPDPSTLDSKFAPTLSSFVNLSVKVDGFSAGNLNVVLTAGQNLPIPNGLDLIEGALNQLSHMAQVIPTNPEQLTAALQGGLGQLLTDLARLDELLQPLTTLVKFVGPLLEKFAFLNETISRINSLYTQIPQQANGLNLGNMPEQFEYLSRLFEVYPEAANISPFKELKAQIDTLKAWLTLNSNTLTEQFRSQIQTLAEALPSQLDEVMQAGVEQIGIIETSLAGLNHNAWCDPYQSALAVVAAMDLNDWSHINDHLTSLNQQVAAVTAAANTLNQNAQVTLAGLTGFDANLAAQDLRAAFLNIIGTISPEKPGIMAVIFRQIQRIIGGLDINAINAAVTQVEQEVDKLMGELDLAKVTTTLNETTQRITGTVKTVDQALLEVALTLSNLVTELKELISKVNLPDLLTQVQSGFGQLKDGAHDLFSQVEAIGQELEQFVNEVGQEVDQFDLEAVAQAIKDLLAEITSVLDAPEIREILTAAEQGIAGIAQQLESVTLKPIFERVIEGINDLKTKLADVDVSELNDFLKVALAAALEILRSIDFDVQVSEVLQAEFQAALAQATALIKPLQEKYDEIGRRLNQFSPGAIVSEKLSPPFEALLAALNKIEPAQLLAPLQKLQTALLAQVEPLNPATLLAPLTDLHAQLLSALQALSPHDLIAPLNALLSQLTGLLDKLNIEAFIAEISGSVGQINTLLSNFLLGNQIRNTEFWGTLAQLQLQGDEFLTMAENHLDQFLDQMVGHIPAVEMSILQPALVGLGASIAVIEAHINTPAILTRLNGMSATLTTQDFSGCISTLTQQWLAQKARFEAVTPPPELTGQYELLKTRLKALSPIVLLAGPATSVGQIKVKLETAQLDLNQARTGLVRLLAENRPKLVALLPAEATAEGFKLLLRETLYAQLGQPIRDLLRVLKKRLQEFGPVLAKIKAIALKFQAPFEALTIIPASIDLIGQTLLETKNKITNINLNFLEDELQSVLDEVLNQLQGLNPAPIIADLETIAQEAKQALAGLYPQAAVQSLDAIYRNILKKLEALHPDKTVAQPVDKAYQEMLQLLSALSVAAIFEALEKKLKTIGQELDEGLEHTAKAFNELLDALPSISAIQIDISVDVGVF